MMSDTTAITKLNYELLTLFQQRATGELRIEYGLQPLQCRLFFYLGRLMYATGGTHPVRRWYRGLQRHCPTCITSGWAKTARSSQELWEVDLLNQAIAGQLIAVNEAKALIKQFVQELLFEVVERRTITTSWHPGTRIGQETAFLAVEQVILELQQLRTQWQAPGMGSQAFFAQISPNMAPVVMHPRQLEEQVSAEAFQSMVKLMQGNHTLWDLALYMQRPLSSVIQVLWPLIQQGVLELRDVADLPAPTALATAAAPTKPQAKKLIACIDDSPAIGQAMTQILEAAGYEVMTIVNPLQGISTLLDRKPSLIFLDLVMPNTNGYELCSFLRKTSVFQNTPIVILTGHDGVIDRVRAKIAGSSDFLAKPPESEKVIQVVNRFLESPSTEVVDSIGSGFAFS
jgi:two-component system, chemotaxis family, response regulator PixG